MGKRSTLTRANTNCRYAKVQGLQRKVNLSLLQWIQGLHKPPCMTSWALCRALLKAALAGGLGHPALLPRSPAAAAQKDADGRTALAACLPEPPGGLRVDVWSRTWTYSTRSKHCKKSHRPTAPQVTDEAVPSISSSWLNALVHKPWQCRSNALPAPGTPAPSFVLQSQHPQPPRS